MALSWRPNKSYGKLTKGLCQFQNIRQSDKQNNRALGDSTNTHASFQAWGLFDCATLLLCNRVAIHVLTCNHNICHVAPTPWVICGTHYSLRLQASIQVWVLFHCATLLSCNRAAIQDLTCNPKFCQCRCKYMCWMRHSLLSATAMTLMQRGKCSTYPA